MKWLLTDQTEAYHFARNLEYHFVKPPLDVNVIE